MDEKEVATNSKSLSRREVIALAGISGTALIIGCGGGGSSTTTSATAATASSTTGTTGTATGGCTVSPEGEIGPYFADDSASGFLRSNVLANIDGTNAQTGVPLTLNIHIYDAENSCKAMAGVQVDIWHCNAYGVYSDEAVESTSSETFLRGYQITDANGLVTFKTIFPGWYSGRTAHIHVRVRSKYSEASSTSDGTNTTQLFFPQAVIDQLYANVAPYSTHGKEDTTNTADHVYTGETHAEMLLTLTGDYLSGYSTTASIYLPITAK